MPIPPEPHSWPEDIQQLIDLLRAVASSSTVANPYTSPNCCHNLGAYLTTLRSHGYSGHLLVGEAPGYMGCALTGIPFTSEAVLLKRKHSFLDALRPVVKLSGEQGEATASMVWDHLVNCKYVAAMWNVFPFHPHRPDEPKSNRKPTPKEVADAKQYLEAIIRILTPGKIVAVGNTAAEGLRKQFPDLEFQQARHPSNGGKKEFLVGMKAAGVV